MALNFSTKVRYATRVILNMARHYPDGVSQLGKLAEMEQISEKYLEHIMRALKQAEIVDSIRGAHGGYKLIIAPDKLTIFNIYEIFEGELVVVECLKTDDCQRLNECVTKDLWREISNELKSSLEKFTIDSLLKMEQGGI